LFHRREKRETRYSARGRRIRGGRIRGLALGRGGRDHQRRLP
jgi:hypothetical protein